MQSLTIIEFVYMIGIDLMFVAVLIFLMLPLGIYRQAAFAVMKRNFVGYFSNPTGYVFLCLFVLLTSFAAFWPHEFFNANLANLDQLNKYLPYIMLGFVPAITMSVWADERRQGTDELLLTMPAGDLDVVTGKYLAAVTIFSVSLLFSMTNLLVLMLLGNPDMGLIFSTYVGYWMVGLAMLAIGMVASFLTSNLTLGFVLGIALNAPLVIADWAQTVITGTGLTQWIERWSIASHFEDLSKGVVSLSSIVYFVSIIVLMLYLSMVLIGRRHWASGELGPVRTMHFAARTVLMVFSIIGLCWLLAARDPIRWDVTSEKLSTLSPKTVELLDGLDEDFRATVEAYVSPESQVPESYVQTRLNLLNALNEIQKASSGKIKVNINETEDFKPEAEIARKRFGITGRRITTRQRGQIRASQIFLGVGVVAGPDKSVIPFFDRGVPTEYELILSITSLDQQVKKKTIGVVSTEANLFGRPAPGSFQPGPDHPVINELRKIYEVKDVDLSQPLTRKYDALLVVQPSSMPQPALNNLVKAIGDGQPTAIFEDPASWANRNISGTVDQRRPQFMRGQMVPPAPKAKIAPLWDLLGVRIPSSPKEDDEGKKVQNPMTGSFEYESWVVRHNYNPFPKVDFFPDEFVFVGSGSGNPNTFNADSKITSSLQHLLLICPGYLEFDSNAKVKIKTLISTSTRTQLVSTDGLLVGRSQDSPWALRPFRKKHDGKKEYPLAVRITGKPRKDAEDLEVVLVSDVDVLSHIFFGLREQGTDEDAGLVLDVDNVTFVLNTIDMLADEQRFVDIRNRRRIHRTLKRFEKITELSRNSVLDAIANYEKQFEDSIEEEQKRGDERLKKKFASGNLNVLEKSIEYQAAQAALREQIDNTRSRLARERDEKINQVKSDLELDIRQMQNSIKRFAVFTPPVIPLVLALIVFLVRRTRELEGAAQSRLR